jgi:hypothetical protein
MLTVQVNGAAPTPENEATVTDESGAFSVGFYFDTLKSYCLVFGHDCSRRPDAIAIAISAPGYEPRTATLSEAEIPSGALDIHLFVPQQETTLVPARL